MIAVNRRRVMGRVKNNCPYITNGLLAYYDGIDNTGYGVHDPNATVWKNLAGDSEWDMSVHADWQSNGLHFDGTWNGIAPKIAQQNITIECVFINANWMSFGWSYAGTYPRMSVSMYNNKTLEGFIGGKTINGVYADGYNHLALTLGDNKSVGTIYANGKFNVSSGVSTTSASFSNNFRLCGYGSNRNTDGSYCTATVHRCMIYLKALTAEEIAYNYNVDKERFGL